MKYEIDKFYKTVGGQKARIYGDDGHEPYKLHGALLTKDGWESNTWTASGRYNRSYTGDRDLTTEEWDDFKPTLPYLAWLFDSPTKASVDLAFFENNWTGDVGWCRAPWLDPPADWSPFK